MKPVIKLGFTDYFEGLDNFFISILSERFTVERDDITPDYLIFCDETFGQNNLNIEHPNLKAKIFYTGENRRPNNYRCSHAVTFDHYHSEKHTRLPLYVIDHWMMVNMHGMPDIRMRHRLLQEKSGFCSFVSSNANVPKRNEFFQKLCTYKKVDAWGPLFNNTGGILPRGIDAAKKKMEKLPLYKFNLCFENGSHPGYVTEKLFHAYYGNTIPIYWGSETVATDFNPNAFLNWHDYRDDDVFFKKIIELDQDHGAYKKMFNESLFHKNNTNYFLETSNFLNWFQANVYRGQYAENNRFHERT